MCDRNASKSTDFHRLSAAHGNEWRRRQEEQCTD
jgi:hypothetical protein